MPLAGYIKKLNIAQRNFSTYEKELLAVIEAMKEVNRTLRGQHVKVVVHTNHKDIVKGQPTIVQHDGDCY